METMHTICFVHSRFKHLFHSGSFSRRFLLNVSTYSSYDQTIRVIFHIDPFPMEVMGRSFPYISNLCPIALLVFIPYYGERGTPS